MASWSMTVDEKTYHSAQIPVALWSAVQQLLDGRVKSFDDLQPYLGPDQLASWYAVLKASASENKDVPTYLQEAYEMPMVQLVSMVSVE